MSDLIERLRSYERTIVTSATTAREMSAWFDGARPTFREAATRIAELERERYIGVPCPICDRIRLLYDPTTHDIRCEKCEATKDTIYDAKPVKRADRAEARVAELEEAGQRLRDFVESGQTSCGYSSAPEWAHSIFGEDATNAVLAWDAALDAVKEKGRG